MNATHIAHRIAAYAWASPNTLLGLFAGLVVLAFGGRLRVIRGALEFSDGWLSDLPSSLGLSLPFRAITFGHVILGVRAAELESVRDHEHVHVAQYESWGPLFLPAYAASSVWQVMRGRRAYRDNFFERQAYAQQKEPSRPKPEFEGTRGSGRGSAMSSRARAAQRER